MKKRSLISLLLAVLLVCGLLTQAAGTVYADPAYSGVCGAAGNNLTWTFAPDTGTLTVRGSGNMADYDSDNKAPWDEIKRDIKAIVLEEGVTGVGSKAFYDAENAVSLSLPSTLTRIGEAAFQYCMSLTELTIPAAVTELPEYAFCDCIDLKRVTLPDSLTAIGRSAFYYCVDLNRINWPASLVSIGDSAFINADLQTVVLPEGLRSVGVSAFEYNNRLRSIWFPDSVVTLGSGAVGHCPILTEVHLPAGLTEIPDSLFASCSALETVEIPSGVTTIGDFAFDDCERLWHLAIPAGVTRIGAYAFSSCPWLLGMQLPASLSYIDFDVFWECERLTGVVVLSHSLRFQSYREDLIFNGPENTTLYGYVGASIQSYAVEFGYPFVDWSTHTHSYHETVLEPSCTQRGYRVQVCNCGDILEAAPIAALGHSYKDGRCIHCGKAAPGSFSDVKESSYYYDAVMWAIENGVTSGTGDGMFSPKQTCTREQIVTFLYAACGRPEHHQTENPFSDVKPGKWYYDAVMWALENGITTGVGDGKFGVGQGCTREQAMTFLWTAKGKPDHENTENPFIDVKSNKYYYDAVMWAVENGVTSGMSENTFGVGSTCTRAQIVTFLYIAFVKTV